MCASPSTYTAQPFILCSPRPSPSDVPSTAAASGTARMGLQCTLRWGAMGSKELGFLQTVPDAVGLERRVRSAQSALSMELSIPIHRCRPSEAVYKCMAAVVRLLRPGRGRIETGRETATLNAHACAIGRRVENRRFVVERLCLTSILTLMPFPVRCSPFPLPYTSRRLCT